MTYQAIYDAIRSKVQGGSVDDAIQSAIRDMNLPHYIDMAMEEVKNAGIENQRWCVILRPKLLIDGDMWCALYGDNLQDGVCGFGSSPSIAMEEFDKAFNIKITPKA